MKQISSISLLLFLSFGFAMASPKEEISTVLKKMNAFYEHNSVQMTTQVTYFLKNNTTETSLKTRYSQQKGNYKSENKDQIIVNNKSFNIDIDLKSKYIYLTELNKDRGMAMNKTLLETAQILELCESKSIIEVEGNFEIKLEDNLQIITFTVSKKDYHLIQYKTEFKEENNRYEKVEVNYQFISSKKIDVNYFSDKQYIKKTKKGYKGTGEYKNYQVVFTPMIKK